MEKIPPTAGAVGNGCLVYEQQGQNVVILVDTPSWYAWLETATTFTFTCDEGTFTAHKARAGNRRGGWYWRAYRRKRGRLSRCYLGVPTNLTLARLREAARCLAADGKGMESSQTDEDAPPPVPVPLASQGLTSSVILQSSITLPRLPVQHVARPRLLALLEQGLRGPVTLVSAPAGSGKTTLLAEWAATTTRPVAWLTFEEAENDPARFLSSLIAALARVEARLDIAAQTDRPWYPPEYEQMLTRLLNDLERLLQHDTVLILDDVHDLTTETSQALLLFLLNHLPSRLHLLIGTRVDPPRLARLRAHQQIVELRREALGFLSAEVEVFAQAMGLSLDSEAIRLLEERTEGWIAGIQLVILALRGHADAARVLRTTGVTHRFLQDYVREEILLRQPPEMQRFLLRTSLLDRLTGPLCESVTEEPDGQLKLESLLQANLFVSALDATGTWYRYHPLFAETLRTLLQQQEPALVPEFYRRASRWYEQHGWAEDACEYALRASDHRHAARLLEELVPSLVEQGKLVRLGRWLDQLPQELISASAYLSLAWIWTRPLHTSQSFDLEKVIERLTVLLKMHEKNDPEAQADLQRELALQQATLALTRGDIPQVLSRAAEMTRSLTGPETAWSQFTLWRQRVLLGAAYRLGGDLLASEQTLRQALPADGSSPNLLVVMSLDDLYEEQGRLRELGRIYEDVLRSLPQHRNSPPLLLAQAHWRYGVLLYEWNRLQEAEAEALQLLELAPRLDLAHPTPELTLLGLGIQARVALAQGNSEQTRQILESEALDVAQFPIPQARKAPLILVPVRLALACGQLEPALQWAASCGLHFDDLLTSPLGKSRYVGYVALARILIARGRGHPNALALSQAQILLDHLLEVAVRTDAHGRRIEIQMLRALALLAQGKTRQALATLGPILAQAEPEGYLRLFADEGEVMAHLLAQMAPFTTASPAYLQRIQAAIAPVQQGRLIAMTKPASLSSPFEPLSTREYEVLQFVAEGLSNQQIAQHLVLSLHTVKLHIKHLLTKLGATNRTQAVAHARALHILPRPSEDMK
ncbi:MAG TPA: LuxR C-terminal-related transcriptional regulator [Ktedonobacteraceae bacterium]|nr:LuxR C-terminal-related transcriptional regulator [Ktedonobacteraceae bacterium]